MSGLKMPFTAGLPETGCGAGSMVANTHEVRSKLPDLMKCHDVGTLLDAPCGDFNWMSETDLSGVDYIGCDFDPEHCNATQLRGSKPLQFRPRSKVVVNLDICRDRLPSADMMLCRDFLQHMPTALVVMALRNFVSSGARWLLATSHMNDENAEIARAGMFRPLNLTAAPFCLKRPMDYISDGEGRILGLWHRNEITC